MTAAAVKPGWSPPMIRYDLKCSQGHGFDAWFRDSAAFDALVAAREVGCAICGDTTVEKMLMTPAVGRSRRDPVAAKPQPDVTSAALSAPPENPIHRALADLRRKLEQEATYVGPRFAAEARRLHAEEKAEPIWGEATAEEARELIGDGIPVAPLPPLPRRDD